MFWNIIQSQHAGGIGHRYQHITLSTVRSELELALSFLLPKSRNLLEATFLGSGTATSNRVIVKRLVVDVDLGAVIRKSLLPELRCIGCALFGGRDWSEYQWLVNRLRELSQGLSLLCWERINDLWPSNWWR